MAGEIRFLESLTEKVAVHQHIGMTLGQIYRQHFSRVTIGGMLQVKFPRGSPLQDSMYGSAEPTLVCKVLSPGLSLRRAKVK